MRKRRIGTAKFFTLLLLLYHTSAKAHGLKLDEQFFGKTIGTNIKVTEELYLQRYGADLPFAEIFQQKSDLMKKYVATHTIPVKKGLYELLQFLQQHKIKTAVATSSNRENALHLLREANVLDYFDYILCGDEVTHSKPAPEIFCKAAEKLSCPVENCLVLEDAPKGILAAHRAGIKTILIPDLAQIDEAAKSLAAATLPSLDEVISYLSK